MILLVPTTPSVIKRWLTDFEYVDDAQWIISGKLFKDTDLDKDLREKNYSRTSIQDIYEKRKNILIKAIFMFLVFSYGLFFLKKNNISIVVVSNDLSYLQRGFSSAAAILGIKVVLKQAAAIQSKIKNDISIHQYDKKNKIKLAINRLITKQIGVYCDVVLVWNDYFKNVVGNEKAVVCPGRWYYKNNKIDEKILMEKLRNLSITIYTQPFFDSEYKIIGLEQSKQVYFDLFSVHERLKGLCKKIKIRIHPQDDFGKVFFSEKNVMLDLLSLENSYIESDIIIGLYTTCFIDARGFGNITVCYTPEYLDEEIKFKMLAYTDVIFDSPYKIIDLLDKASLISIYRGGEVENCDIMEYLK